MYRRLAGWSEDVQPLKSKSILWNRIWQETGCPSSGVLAQLRKHAKTRYKYAARRVIRTQENRRRERLAEAMLRYPSRDFWREVRQTKVSKHPPASYVDGIHGDSNIASLWATKFKDLMIRHQALAIRFTSLQLLDRTKHSIWCNLNNI